MADNYLERQYELLQARKAQMAKRKQAEAKKRAREREKARAAELAAKATPPAAGLDSNPDGAVE
jgi:hypothetical protein